MKISYYFRNLSLKNKKANLDSYKVSKLALIFTTEYSDIFLWQSVIN